MADGTSDLRQWRLWALWLIAAHTAVVAVHSVAHGVMGVIPSTVFDNTVILLCYYAGPIAAAYAISRGKEHGALLLLGSMLTGFAYGFVSHFLIDGSDNVGSAGWQGWGFAFGATSVVLAMLEALAAVIGWRLLAAGRRRSSHEAPAPTL